MPAISHNYMTLCAQASFQGWCPKARGKWPLPVASGLQFTGGHDGLFKWLANEKREKRSLQRKMSMNALHSNPDLTGRTICITMILAQWCSIWHFHNNWGPIYLHYSDVTMGSMASQITSLTIVYSTVYSGADQRKHQNSASLASVRGIHQWPVNSPHKWPVTRKMFPFDDVIMYRD